jgi:hypothetical protein
MPRIAASNRRQQPLRFEVSGLFNRFKYEIGLPTEEKPVQFLSAPNGHGKSTTLKMIDDLTRLRWKGIASTVFQTATMYFDRGTQLTVARQRKGTGHVNLAVSCTSPDHEPLEYSVNIVETQSPWIRGNPNQGYRDARTGEQLTPEEVVRFISDDGPTATSLPELRSMTYSLSRVFGTPAIYYLDAHRLRRELREESVQSAGSSSRGESSTHSINEVSEKVAAILRRTTLEYGRVSRSADRAYLPRALKALRQPRAASQIDPLSLSERYSRLREQESRLQSLALTDGVMDTITEEDYLSTDQTARLLLDQFLDDIEQRFAVLETTAKQLSLFRDTINTMLESKRIRFNTRLINWHNRRVGFEAVADNDEIIPLTSLSSGEQHLIVMFGRILFDSECEGGGLILLDEPEISLHPEWQITLSESLKKVAAINNCRMLLATHSPTLIGNDWDSETALKNMQVP